MMPTYATIQNITYDGTSTKIFSYYVLFIEMVANNIFAYSLIFFLEIHFNIVFTVTLYNTNL